MMAYFISSLGSFLICLYFFKNRSWVQKSVLSATFSSSLVLAQLSIAEALSYGDPEWRAFFWKHTSAWLLGLVGFVLPAMHLVEISKLYLPKNVQQVFSLSAFSGYVLCLILAAIALRSQNQDDEETLYKRGASFLFMVRQSLLAVVSLASVTFLAVMAGLSSVSAPYNVLLQKPPEVDEATLARIDASIESSTAFIAEKTALMKSMEVELANKPWKPSPSLVGRIVSALNPSGEQAAYAAAKDEVEAMERLIRELQDEREAVQVLIRDRELSTTVWGRIRRGMYTCFAIYCLYRLSTITLRTLSRLLYPSSNSSEIRTGRDMVVDYIAGWAAQRYPKLTKQSWTQVLGALMSGVLFVASLSGILKNLRKLTRLSRSNLAGPVPLNPFVVAHAVGIYVLSLATVLRFSIPSSVAGPLASALSSPLEPRAAQAWSDFVFCIAAAFMAVAIGFTSFVQSSGTLDEEAQKYD